MIPGKVCTVANWENVQWSRAKYVKWQNGKMAKCPMIPGKVGTVGNWENVLWSLVKYVKWQNGKMSYDPWQSMQSGKLAKCPMVPGEVSKVANWQKMLTFTPRSLEDKRQRKVFVGFIYTYSLLILYFVVLEFEGLFNYIYSLISKLLWISH